MGSHVRRRELRADRFSFGGCGSRWICLARLGDDLENVCNRVFGASGGGQNDQSNNLILERGSRSFSCARAFRDSGNVVVQRHGHNRETIEVSLGQTFVLAGCCFVISSWLELVTSAEAGNEFSLERLQRNVNVATCVFMLSVVPFVLSTRCAPDINPNMKNILEVFGLGSYALYIVLLLSLAAYSKKEFLRITASKLTLTGVTNEFKMQIISTRKRVQTTVSLLSVAAIIGFVGLALNFTVPYYW
jgi:hypothetical protein